MPATFDPDQIRASLKPLAEWQPLSDEAKAYQRFYQTDFPHRDVWRGMVKRHDHVDIVDGEHVSSCVRQFSALECIYQCLLVFNISTVGSLGEMVGTG